MKSQFLRSSGVCALYPLLLGFVSEWLRTSFLVVALSICVSPLSAQYLRSVGGESDQSDQSGAKTGKVVEFRVSKAGKDQSGLSKVFLAVQAQEELNKGKLGNSKFFKVVQRINMHEYIVNFGTNPNFWLVTNSDIDIADGECLSMNIAPTGKTREYTSVLGAKVTLREYAQPKEEDLPPPLSKEEFVDALKNGKTWTLKDFVTAKCFRCGGAGKLGALEKYAKCNDCGGKGTLVSDCLVKW